MLKTRTTKETIKKATYETKSFLVAHDIYEFDNAINDIVNPNYKENMQIRERDTDQLKTLKGLILNKNYDYYKGQEILGMYSFSDYKQQETGGLRVINLYTKDDKLIDQIIIYWC